MSVEKEIGARLRAARPAVQASPPPFARVRARIEQTAGGSPRAPRMRWPRANRVPWPRAPRVRWPRRFGALVALSVIAIAGCAWGASQLLSGSTVDSGFPPANPSTGLGAPLRSSFGLLGLRRSDPAGGLPWGMRIIRTTRGEACLQVGRVLDGKVGAVGSGYAFHDDGRFHPFSVEDALGLACVHPDARGRVFDAQGPITVSADGLSLAESISDRVHCDLPGQHNWGFRCPRSQLRLLAFGALGPDAASLNVSYEGRSFTVTPFGQQGAYLLVFPAPKGTNVGYFGAQAHAQPTLTVRFENGQTCRLPAMNDTDLCQPEGIDFSTGPPVSAAELASPVHVSYGRHVSGGEPPFVRTGPNRAASAPPMTGPGPAITLTFTARVGVGGPLSTYAAEVERPVVKGCFGGDALVSQGASPTISKGQRTRIIIPLGAACHGRYSGRVFYFAIKPSAEPAGEERLLTGVSARLIPVLHRPPPGITVGRFTITIPSSGAPARP
jgi:hypothetical protein